MSIENCSCWFLLADRERKSPKDVAKAYIASGKDPRDFIVRRVNDVIGNIIVIGLQ